MVSDEEPFMLIVRLKPCFTIALEQSEKEVNIIKRWIPTSIEVGRVCNWGATGA